MESADTVRLVIERPNDRGEGTVARIVLDRPAAKNALRPDEWQRLRAHAAAIAATPPVRVVVITGAGGAFSAGGDLKTMPERLLLDEAARAAQLFADGQALVDLVALGRPIVSLIDGPCSGAGLALALVAHVRIATANARFAAPFLKVGLTADFAVRYLLERTCGRTHADALLLLGESCDGARAVDWGLVHRVVPDAAALDGASEDVISTLLAHPPLALQRLIAAAPYQRPTLAEAIAWDATQQAACSQTADAKEGVAAFLAKRPPVFAGS